MNHKERVQEAIRHHPTDRVPKGELCIDDALIADFFGIEKVDFADRLAFMDHLGLDLVCLQTQYGDLPDPEFAGWPDIDDWATQTDRFIFVLIDGCFSWGVRRFGFEEFLVALSRQSPEILTLFRNVESLNAQLIRKAADQGATGVVLADDIAYQGGPMAHPKLLRECFFPALERQVALSKALGLFSFFHSDGNLRTLLPDIAGCHPDGLQCIESAAGMDLLEVRKAYGKSLCLWGNLDPTYLMMPQDTAGIEAAVEAVRSAGGKQGGFIFGTSSGLFKGMLRENIEIAYGID